MNNITNLEKKQMTRRAFLAASFYTLLGIVTAAIAVPIIGYIIPPPRRKEEKWIELGPTSQFKINEPTLVGITPPGEESWKTPEKEGIFVVNKGDGNFDVFSMYCTHLGCPVQWNPVAKRFFSPCHGGVFDLNGKVLGGPPPRPLDRLPAKIEKGKLFVTYKRFLLGHRKATEI